MRIERQQSRRSEEQRFDGMRRQPFAQNGFVGYAPRQRKVGFLILTVAQRAEVKQFSAASCRSASTMRILRSSRSKSSDVHISLRCKADCPARNPPQA